MLSRKQMTVASYLTITARFNTHVCGSSLLLLASYIKGEVLSHTHTHTHDAALLGISSVRQKKGARNFIHTQTRLAMTSSVTGSSTTPTHHCYTDLVPIRWSTWEPQEACIRKQGQPWPLEMKGKVPICRCPGIAALPGSAQSRLNRATHTRTQA